MRFTPVVRGFSDLNQTSIAIEGVVSCMIGANPASRQLSVIDSGGSERATRRCEFYTIRFKAQASRFHCFLM
jgi:hypothetical protein